MKIDNHVPVGSLLKRKRGRDEEYLSLIRQCPCLGCGQDPAGEAAHVRMSSAFYGKPHTGMAQKPDDKWTVPLCHKCHMEQHQVGELNFWFAMLELNPLRLCAELSKAEDLNAMRAIVLKAH